MSLGAGVFRISKAVQCSNMRVGTLGAASTRHCHTQPFSRIRNHQFLPKPLTGGETQHLNGMQVTMLYETTPCEELQASNCVKTRHHIIVVGKTANQLWFEVKFDVF